MYRLPPKKEKKKDRSALYFGVAVGVILFIAFIAIIVPEIGLGVSKFINLDDTPSSYVGESGKVVTVKATEDGLEFTAIVSPGTPNLQTVTNTGSHTTNSITVGGINTTGSIVGDTANFTTYLGLPVDTLQAVTDSGSHTTNSIEFAGGTVTARLYLDADIFTDRWSNLQENTIIGVGAAGADTMTGDDNSLFGYSAGHDLTSGQDNTMIGRGAGSASIEATGNVFVGRNAGQDNTDGDYNVFIGQYAGRNNILSDYNTFIGSRAGESGTDNDGCVFIGYDVGSDETGDDLLYIDNSNTATPLIWGDFNNDEVKVNGAFNAGSPTGGNYLEIKDDGELNLHGDARVWKCRDLDPANIGKPNTDPPAIVDYQGFKFDAFDDTTEEQVYYLWHLPSDFAEGTSNIRGHFGLMVSNPDAVVDEYIVMGFEYKLMEPGDVFDFTALTSSGTVTTTITGGETAYTWHASPLGYVDTTGFDHEGVVMFRFYRDTGSAVDDYTGDVLLGSYHLEYLSDRLGEPI